MKKLIPTLAGSMGITMAMEEDTPKDQLEDYNLIKKIIKLIGDDSEREGVLDTPKRVIKSWKEIYGGYKEDPVKILKTQFNQKYDQMVVLKDIEFYSTCEHHMLPFYGIAHIGYLPKDKVVGLSKLARLVDCFSKRLQIQENLTEQIAGAIQTNLNPLGCGVIIQAEHFCMKCRGIKKQKPKMITCALRGNFFIDSVKSEFHKLIL
tara:strand:+ start:1672 stop:2289 length:618 start_codon:yes stop_codon:yes gene_type:complete